jgi:predicted porin
MAKVMGHYTNDTREASATSGEAEGKGWLLGALVPVGAGEIRASYSQYQIEVGGTEPEAKQFALGYVHNLSKRTAIYTTYSRVKNENGSAYTLNGSTLGTGNNSTGFDLGIRHSF